MIDTLNKLVSELKQFIKEEVARQLTGHEPSPIDPPETKRTEQGNYGGRGGSRPRWYFSKHLHEYPPSIRVKIPGYRDKVITHNNRLWMETGRVGGFAIKEADSGSGMAIVAGPECRSEKCTIEY